MIVAGRRRDRVGGGDRRGRAAGPRARGGAGDADLRQGVGADGDRSRRLRRQAVRSEDHRGALLHAERPVDPGPGHHAQHRGRGDRAARRSDRGRRAARARSAEAPAQRAGGQGRRRTSAWTTTSCRWRSTTCAPGPCSRGRSAGRGSGVRGARQVWPKSRRSASISPSRPGLKNTGASMLTASMRVVGAP